jgi:hypothetical protein
MNEIKNSSTKYKQIKIDGIIITDYEVWNPYILNLQGMN